MLDFLFELLLGMLAGLGELLLEAVLELVLGVVVDFASRLLSSASETLGTATPIAATLTYAVLGMLAGGCSLLIFPHHLVHPSRIRGISLLISPAIAGAALSLIGTLLRSRDKASDRIENFRYGFAFAFGVALVRLLFAH